MRSKTKIEKKLRRKTKPELVGTVINAKKHNEWMEVANIISGPTRKKPTVNLEKINEQAKEGDIIVVPGKVLGFGDIDKKLKIVALDFSQEAKEKLKEKKCIISSLRNEIQENPKARGVKIIK